VIGRSGCILVHPDVRIDTGVVKANEALGGTVGDLVGSGGTSGGFNDCLNDDADAGQGDDRLVAGVVMVCTRERDLGQGLHLLLLLEMTEYSPALGTPQEGEGKAGADAGTEGDDLTGDEG
jgi:hypothetical protein